jgi:hypothetical protein
MDRLLQKHFTPTPLVWIIWRTDRSNLLQVRQVGDALFGLGLIFYSMELMSSAFSFVKHDANFLLFLARMENPWLGMLVSTAFTGLIQSSGATMGILLSLARQGMLGMDASMGLMLGANVGTCVTGLLAAIGQSRDALRLASVLMLIRMSASMVGKSKESHSLPRDVAHDLQRCCCSLRSPLHAPVRAACALSHPRLAEGAQTRTSYSSAPGRGRQGEGQTQGEGQEHCVRARGLCCA